MPGFGHLCCQYCGDSVSPDTHQYWNSRSLARDKPSRQNCERQANILNHEQGSNEVSWFESQCHPKIDRHRHHGVDAINIEPKCDNEEKKILVFVDVFERSTQPQETFDED